MPTIYDNIEQKLLDGLRKFFDEKAKAAAFCVGYLNLRGWEPLLDLVERLAGGSEESACRVLVGMHRPPEEEMKALARLKSPEASLDGPTLARLKHRITESFKHQLAFGVPTAQAENTLRRLALQLRSRKVFLKAFLRHPLHAKLYLIRRDAPISLVGFVGSSNLTLAGLAQQMEYFCQKSRASLYGQ